MNGEKVTSRHCYFPLSRPWQNVGGSPPQQESRTEVLCWDSPAATRGELENEGGTLLVSQEGSNHPKQGADPPKPKLDLPSPLTAGRQELS